MRLGIEFTSCKDAIGRKHFRVAPYFRGSTDQLSHAVAIIAFGLLFASLMLLGIFYTDVPMTKPHVDMTPYYQVVR